jgi:U3 small nucleolar RNA-associated protein 13
MSLRIYDVPVSSATLPKPLHPSRVVARAHDAPIHVCIADPTSNYVASGSADGVVKVWDICRGYVTHVFKGHGGVISALKFNYPRDPTSAVQLREQQFQLITACVDAKVRIFDLVAARETGRKGGPAKAAAVLEGHHSVPRGLDVSADGRWLISGGRDSVVLFWDLTGAPGTKASAKGKDRAIAPVLVKTIPVLERVEAVGLLSPGEQLVGSSTSTNLPRFFTAGEKGVVTVWDTHSGSVLCNLGEEHETDSADQEEQRQILDVV